MVGEKLVVIDKKLKDAITGLPLKASEIEKELGLTNGSIFQIYYRRKKTSKKTYDLIMNLSKEYPNSTKKVDESVDDITNLINEVCKLTGLGKGALGEKIGFSKSYLTNVCSGVCKSDNCRQKLLDLKNEIMNPSGDDFPKTTIPTFIQEHIVFDKPEEVSFDESEATKEHSSFTVVLTNGSELTFDEIEFSWSKNDQGIFVKPRVESEVNDIYQIPCRSILYTHRKEIK